MGRSVARRGIPQYFLYGEATHDVGAQALQDFFAGLLQRFGPAVDDTLAIDAGHSAFAGEEGALSERMQHLADQPGSHKQRNYL